MRKNNRGITLIALIVTIIVLIIIAGISIATLTADNGILRQTNAAKVSQIEGNAREQVKLACSAMRLAVAEAQAKDNSYSAKANSSLIQAKLIEVLNADKKDLTGSFSNGGTAAGDDQEEITIVYVGDDYTQATNNPDANITYTIGLSQKTVELKDEANVTLKDQHGNDVEMDIGANTGSGPDEGDGSGEGSGSDTGVAGAYLVDTVEIGDYVDIDVDYTNQYSFSSGHTTATSGDELKGWRVLSKSGSGASGTVTLVAAGTPLTYYHPSGGVSATSITNLSDLSEITITTSGIGFRANGFTGATADSENKINIGNLLSENSRINTSAGVHALTTSEVETAYEAITGTTKTINELYGMSQPCKTSNMQTAATGDGNTMSAKANDLLGIGMAYWLGGSSISTNYLWLVYYNGFVSYINRSTYGVRPVLNLNSGIQINSTNVGDGLSVSSAYTLN